MQTYIAALEKQLRAYKNSGAELPRPPLSSGDGDGGDGAGTSPGREPQDEESANAIRLLSKRNQALQQEMEEEKAEVKRRWGDLI